MAFEAPVVSSQAFGALTAGDEAAALALAEAVVCKEEYGYYDMWRPHVIVLDDGTFYLTAHYIEEHACTVVRGVMSGNGREPRWLGAVKLCDQFDGDYLNGYVLDVQRGGLFLTDCDGAHYVTADSGTVLELRDPDRVLNFKTYCVWHDDDDDLRHPIYYDWVTQHVTLSPDGTTLVLFIHNIFLVVDVRNVNALQGLATYGCVNGHSHDAESKITFEEPRWTGARTFEVVRVSRNEEVRHTLLVDLDRVLASTIRVARFEEHCRKFYTPAFCKLRDATFGIRVVSIKEDPVVIAKHAAEKEAQLKLQRRYATAREAVAVVPEHLLRTCVFFLPFFGNVIADL